MEPEPCEELVEGLRELHQPKFVPGVAGQTNDVTYCRECSRTWPCRTMRLVEGQA